LAIALFLLLLLGLLIRFVFICLLWLCLWCCFIAFTKRFTALCHLVLGVGLSLAPIGAYLAVTGSFALLPLLFSFAVIFWVSGFDIIYALQDVDFDQSHQLNSIPAALGKDPCFMGSAFIACWECFLCKPWRAFTVDFILLYFAGLWGFCRAC
jgi:4-hydroxybenzoate polyprenyltransferase